jgi:DNA-binding transcriptional ArsR family regulator
MRRYGDDMGHRRNSEPRATALDRQSAVIAAEVLAGLANPGRLRIVDRLRHGSLTVGELVTALDMEQSAVSHQLRHLRDLGFVSARRHGRHISYQLFDDHVADLVDQALSHAEHLRLAGAPARAQTS